ncbi:hypothetical protein [Algibacillus agarilyticus]|uniref:hypothetical protein n=1 Tax=Algibacillus agarilyticus TaxID=2234133 RepID=UPI000DCFA8BE|nr:hypothetical protein [Algibacillus agarilyticus]
MSNKLERIVWVSYASAQQNFVDGLGKAIHTSYSSASGNADTPFRIVSYLRKSKNGEERVVRETDSGTEQRSYQTVLNDGQPIRHVVEMIGSALRRVIIISPEYINSYYCLWELAACLAYAQHNNNKIFIILDGYSSMRNVIDEPVSLRDEQSLSLPQALEKVYLAEIETKLLPEFHIDRTEHPDIQAFYKQQLENIKSTLYRKLNDREIERVDEEVRQTEVTQIEQPLDQYVKSLCKEDYKKLYRDYIDRLVTDWSKNPYSQQCIEQYKQDKHHDFKFKWLLEQKLARNGEIGAFIACIKRLINVKDYSSSNVKRWQDCLQQLACIFSVCRVDPEWAIETQDASFGGLSIRFTYQADSQNTEQKQVSDCLIATTAVQQDSIQFEPKSKARNPQAAGCIDIFARRHSFEEQQLSQNKIEHKVLREIICQVSGDDYDDIDDLFADSSWVADFRNDCLVHNKPGRAVPNIRLFIDHHKFNKKQDSQYSYSLIKKLLFKLNQGEDRVSEQVNLGVVQLFKNDLNIITFVELEGRLDAHFRSIFKLLKELSGEQ